MSGPLLVGGLGANGGLDRSRCAIDSVNTRVMKGSWRIRIL
ncbi:hypothetical protein ACFV1C_34835 [Streptomyces sp. NPDC059605]